MRKYELIFILRSTSSADGDVNDAVERVSSIITDRKGEVLQVDRWGLKKLAYSIKKDTQGFYVFMLFSGTPDCVDEIERILRIDDRYLKYLTVKQVTKKPPRKKKKPVDADTDTGMGMMEEADAA